MHAATSTSPSGSKLSLKRQPLAPNQRRQRLLARQQHRECCKSVTLEQQKQGGTVNTKIESKSFCESVKELGFPFIYLLTNSFFRRTPAPAEAGKSNLSTALKIAAVYVQNKGFLSRRSLAKLIAKAGSALKGNGGFRP
jgi:hypothetical protein